MEFLSGDISTTRAFHATIQCTIQNFRSCSTNLSGLYGLSWTGKKVKLQNWPFEVKRTVFRMRKSRIFVRCVAGYVFLALVFIATENPVGFFSCKIPETVIYARKTLAVYIFYIFGSFYFYINFELPAKSSLPALNCPRQF